MSDNQQLPPGTRVNQYQIERLIARGGMAEVYLAADTVLSRPVCLKVMLSQLTRDSDLIKRFHREAQAIARLHHPHIVTIYDVGMTPDNRPYLAMEYIPGGTLADLVQRRRAAGSPLTPVEVLEIMEAVVKALGAIHQAGMVHRDLKPSNILMRHDNSPVLADLGIAAVADASRLTRTGHMLGTPQYMAPEQVRGVPLDGRADIYALGIILYELFAGEPPFEGDDVMAVMHQQLTLMPVPLHNTRPGLSPSVYKLVERCLLKEPARRYQDTAELMRRMRRALESERTGMWKLGRPRLGRFFSREGMFRLKLGGAIIAVAAVGCAFAMWQMEGQPETAAVTRVPTSTPSPTAEMAEAAAAAPIALLAAEASPSETAAAPASDTPPPPSPTPLPPSDTPLPPPTATPTAAATSTSRPTLTPFIQATETPSVSCLPPSPRWETTLYARYRTELGCPVSPAFSPEAAYQIFSKGLMLWRAQPDVAYILYYDNGSFDVIDVTGFPRDYPNQSDLLKGAFGYMWNSWPAVRDRVKEPAASEANPTDFIVQDYQYGTIFYFLENNANNYVLFSNSRTWLTAGE